MTQVLCQRCFPYTAYFPLLQTSMTQVLCQRCHPHTFHTLRRTSMTPVLCQRCRFRTLFIEHFFWLRWRKFYVGDVTTFANIFFLQTTVKHASDDKIRNVCRDRPKPGCKKCDGQYFSTEEKKKKIQCRCIIYHIICWRQTVKPMVYHYVSKLISINFCQMNLIDIDAKAIFY